MRRAGNPAAIGPFRWAFPSSARTCQQRRELRRWHRPRRFRADTSSSVPGGGQRSIAGMPYILISTQIRLVCMLRMLLLFTGTRCSSALGGCVLSVDGFCRMFLRNACVCTLGKKKEQQKAQSRSQASRMYACLFLSFS